MGTYSFLSVQATLSGPGGLVALANGAAAAEEGITVSMADDKNTLTTGAGGEGMHSLHAGKSGSLTVRLLKTSKINALLMQMYNLQTSNPALHGINTLTVRDTHRGDVVVCRDAAFKKAPDLNYAKDGGMNEWVFDAIYIDETLGVGTAARVL
jgi:hypothetical protein